MNNRPQNINRYFRRDYIQKHCIVLDRFIRQINTWKEQRKTTWSCFKHKHSPSISQKQNKTQNKEKLFWFCFRKSQRRSHVLFSLLMLMSLVLLMLISLYRTRTVLRILLGLQNIHYFYFERIIILFWRPRRRACRVAGLKVPNKI